MPAREITFTLPEELYQEALRIQEEGLFPNIDEFFRQAIEEKLKQLRDEAWQHKLKEIQEKVVAAGGSSRSIEEIVTELRKIREQVFEEEYAYLYR